MDGLLASYVFIIIPYSVVRKYFLYNKTFLQGRATGRNMLESCYKSSLRIKFLSVLQKDTSGARESGKPLPHIFYRLLWPLEIPCNLLTNAHLHSPFTVHRKIKHLTLAAGRITKEEKHVNALTFPPPCSLSDRTSGCSVSSSDFFYPHLTHPK